MRPRRRRRLALPILALSLALVLIDVITRYGANAGFVLGYTAAFCLWLGLLGLGWRWFSRLDRGDDGGVDGA